MACKGLLNKACKEAAAGGSKAALHCLEDKILRLFPTAGEQSGEAARRKLSEEEEDEQEEQEEEQEDFEECAMEVRKVVKLKNEDYRLSPDLHDNCRADVARLCAAQHESVDAVSSTKGRSKDRNKTKQNNKQTNLKAVPALGKRLLHTNY